KSLIFAQKDLKEFSSEIVLGKLRFDNPELYKQKLEKLNQLTSEDIQRVAKKYFYSKNRYVGYIVPKK
ncbi:MAG: zinc protease, partial [Thermosipho sp. (in: thermotogales)]|nr:zinc protease [Thermosipho sp. (in: thermotogales)]